MQPSTYKRGALIAALLLPMAWGANAHHSTAEFDYTKTLTIEGVVKEVQWTNPHSYLQVLVSTDDSAEPEQWSIEIGSPAINSRMGWRKDSVKVGDKVSMEIAPARNGTPYGTLRVLTKEDGSQLHGVASNVRGERFGGGQAE